MYTALPEGNGKPQGVTFGKKPNSSSSSGARSGTDIGDHASPNISVIRQLQKI